MGIRPTNPKSHSNWTTNRVPLSPPEAMQQEQAIVAALGAVRGFRIAGEQLTLVNDSGEPVLRAVAVALR